MPGPLSAPRACISCQRQAPAKMRMADLNLMAVCLGIYRSTVERGCELKGAGSVRICEQCLALAIAAPEGAARKKLCAAIIERLSVRYSELLEAGKA